LERLGPAVRRALQETAERTARKEAEQALHKTQERLSYLLAKSPAIIYALRLEGESLTPVWVSENIQSLLGYCVPEVCQPGWWHSCIHPDDRAALSKDANKLFTQNQIVHEYRVRHKQGDYRWIIDEQRLIRDAAGKSVEVVGSWTDVTERKQLEEQFRQAQKMDAIGQLAGGVAHDFNNLLTVIRGNSELLLMTDEELADESKNHLKQVISASERAAGLTRQLLVFGRKHMIQPRALRLNDIVTDLTKMLGRLIGAQIQLKCRYADPLPFIQADAGMMEQVLMNLVVNARDAMPAGGELTIVTEPVRLNEQQAGEHPAGREGEFVRMNVSDTGCGIPPVIIGRIFEPFFTTKEVGKGTGLGLSTVYGIVKQHHGWIEVKSEVGRGTTFEVYLPTITAPKGNRSGGCEELELRGGNEQILLVEDDEPVRLFAARVLEKMGYTVVEAMSGKAALDMWEMYRNQIDLVVTDIIMPDGLTGWELAKALHSERPNLNVIFTSGYSHESTDQNGDLSRNEGNYFLQKPYSSRTLIQAVRKCLDHKGAGI
jgi:two-component system, cell cycle sensor histidine kinase and response regulator CckA